MPTTTTGTFFLSRYRPTATINGDSFTLQLKVRDNQGPQRVEAYVVTWAGEDARAWWREHQHIQPGTPLRLTLHQPRTVMGLRVPEIHATVTACELAPVAPSWMAKTSSTTTSTTPRAMPA